MELVTKKQMLDNMLLSFILGAVIATGLCMVIIFTLN